MAKKSEETFKGLAKCTSCGETLIAPDDGMPYWCIKCSHEEDLKKGRR